MSDLHLTENQVAELLKMGIAGQMAADDLKRWRACRGKDKDWEEWLDRPGLGPRTKRAIRNSRNTAELRAAAMYWSRERARMGHALDLNKYRRMQVDVTEEECDIAIEKLEAITQAYDEAMKS